MEFDFLDVFVAADGTPYPESRRRLRGRGCKWRLGQGLVGRLLSGATLLGTTGAATAPHTRRTFPKRVEFLEFLNFRRIPCAGNNLAADDFTPSCERAQPVCYGSDRRIPDAVQVLIDEARERCGADRALEMLRVGVRGQRCIGWLSLTVTVLESLAAYRSSPR
jgi:hypothetical protein